MVTIKYQALFTVVLQHDYYGNAAFDDLQLVPSVGTIDQLRNHKIVCRTTGNVLTAMIQTESNKPVIAPGNGLSLRFFISVSNAAFNNFSALRMVGMGSNIYYFSSKSNNKKNGHLFLSAPMPSYNAGQVYEMGAVVKNGSRVFECIKANSPADPHATTAADFWRDIVIHQAGTLPAYADTKTYVIGDTVKVGQKIFECLQPNDPQNKHVTTETTFWQEIKEIAYVSDADLVDTATIMGERPSPKTLGIIDIFFGAGETADFQVLKATGEVQAAAFFIRFKNRSTTWKYISQKKSVTAITELNSLYTFSNAAVSNEFVSDVPIPLSFSPLSSIKMNAIINARPLEITGLQNPTANMITPSDSTSKYTLFSEIFLNY